MGRKISYDGLNYRDNKSGRIICKTCKVNAGSEYDGLCTSCRGGVTAYEAKQKALRQKR